MKTLRERLTEQYGEFYATTRFKNEQEERLSGQPFGADINKPDLSFDEFLDSFLGTERANAVETDYDDDWTMDQEIDHLGEVLADESIE